MIPEGMAGLMEVTLSALHIFARRCADPVSCNVP